MYVNIDCIGGYGTSSRYWYCCWWTTKTDIYWYNQKRCAFFSFSSAQTYENWFFDDRMLHFPKPRKLFPQPILPCLDQHLLKNCSNLVHWEKINQSKSKILSYFKLFSSFARTDRAKPILSTETTTTTAASDSQKPPPSPSLLSQYTNGHHSSPDNSNNQPQTTVIENGRSDHDLGDEIDNDDQ